MRLYKISAVAIAVAALGYYLVPAFAQMTTLGPVATVTAIPSQTTTAIATANPSRKALQICNVGASSTTWIWPGPSTTPISAYSLPAISSGTIVCFTPPSSLREAGIGASWYAVSGATATTISVLEY